MKSIILSILILVSCIPWANAQGENALPLKSNAIYGTVAFLGLGAAANLNYERQIGTTNTWLFRNMAIKVGYGGLNVWDTRETTYMSTLNFLSGKGKHHLELNGGLVLFDSPIGLNLNWAGNMGYRFQQPNRYFIFRIGIGNPEGLYLSLGSAF